MTLNGWIQIALFSVIIIAITRPLGGFLTSLATGTRNVFSPVLAPVERGIGRFVGGMDLAQQVRRDVGQRRGRHHRFEQLAQAHDFFKPGRSHARHHHRAL